MARQCNIKHTAPLGVTLSRRLAVEAEVIRSLPFFSLSLYTAIMKGLLLALTTMMTSTLAAPMNANPSRPHDIAKPMSDAQAPTVMPQSLLDQSEYDLTDHMLIEL